MTQYNILNVKLPNSQLNQWKFGRKDGTELTLKLSSNVVGDSNDETNFHINCYSVIHNCWGFVKLLQLIHQLIKNYQ